MITQNDIIIIAICFVLVILIFTLIAVHLKNKKRERQAVKNAAKAEINKMNSEIVQILNSVKKEAINKFKGEANIKNKLESINNKINEINVSFDEFSHGIKDFACTAKNVGEVRSFARKSGINQILDNTKTEVKVIIGEMNKLAEYSNALDAAGAADRTYRVEIKLPDLMTRNVRSVIGFGEFDGFERLPAVFTLSDIILDKNAYYEDSKDSKRDKRVFPETDVWLSLHDGEPHGRPFVASKKGVEIMEGGDIGFNEYKLQKFYTPDEGQWFTLKTEKDNPKDKGHELRITKER